jgi:uncharacterized membrane protein
MVRTRDLATSGIVVLIALASAFYAPRLPEAMAINFNAAGEPNNFVQKELALIGSVLLAGGLAVLFALLPRVDPLGENFDEFQTAYDGFAVATLGFLTYIDGLVLAYNLGFEFGMMEAIAPAVGALYLLLALLLRRAEQNWFVGIRTPWTLSDERVWDRTHRHTAPLFVVAAVLALGAAVFPEFATVFLGVPVVVIAIGSTLYSFVLYRRFDHT